MPTRAQAAREICEIGRRLYQRGFAAANDGNLSCRIGPGRVLCTPTLICKGFMRPRDLCVVDLEGRQHFGRRRRTSEILLHLELYRTSPRTQAVVHCHPPHVAAFAVTRRRLPRAVLPEVELFLGDVPVVPYETPGTARFASLIRPHAMKCRAAVLKNHGAVSWADTLERAWWWTEILDAYCRILLLARPLGRIDSIPPAKRRELRALRSKFLPTDASE